MSRRIITTENLEEDIKIENNLRPQLLDDYIGQEKIKEMLKVYIAAAKRPRRCAGSCAFLWTTRSWKNDACRYYCQRNACECEDYLWSGN